MKIISYSDLHLEFGSSLKPPKKTDADLMILAGDIITFRNYHPLDEFLRNWNKPVLFVAGNHEYYTQIPIEEEEARFQSWLAEHHPNVIMLQNTSISIENVHFFGGTMWTDFNESDAEAMDVARHRMNDYKRIFRFPESILTPEDTVILHQEFVSTLLEWFEKPLTGTRVVISHHAPVINASTQYGDSPLMPAFNSRDMLKIIQRYQPRLWVYGHTHECDNQRIGTTQIISNQLGYPLRNGKFECQGFDKKGFQIEV